VGCTTRNMWWQGRQATRRREAASHDARTVPRCTRLRLPQPPPAAYHNMPHTPRRWCELFSARWRAVILRLRGRALYRAADRRPARPEPARLHDLPVQRRGSSPWRPAPCQQLGQLVPLRHTSRFGRTEWLYALHWVRYSGCCLSVHAPSQTHMPSHTPSHNPIDEMLDKASRIHRHLLAVHTQGGKDDSLKQQP